MHDANSYNKCNTLKDKGTHRLPLLGIGWCLGNGTWLLLRCSLYNKKLMVNFIKLKVVIHPAEEGRFWAEVPAISGCATQGETIEKLLTNLYEAVEA